MACLALRASLLLGVLMLNNFQGTNAYPRLINNIQDLESDVETCIPDEVFEIDCNICYCSSDGLTAACTKRACLPEEMTEEHLQYLDDTIPRSTIRRKRDIIFRTKKERNGERLKRGLGDYNDPNQDFYNYDEPSSQQERQEQERQARLLQRQIAEDRRREKLELVAQQKEVSQQVEQMQAQLEYQRALDDLQRQYDEAQQDLDGKQLEMDRQQDFYDKQQEENIQKQLDTEIMKKDQDDVLNMNTTAPERKYINGSIIPNIKIEKEHWHL